MRVSRAAWGLEQAERERVWAAVSARGEGGPWATVPAVRWRTRLAESLLAGCVVSRKIAAAS